MYEQNEDNLTFYGYHLSGINGLDKTFCKVVVKSDFVSIYTGNELIKKIPTKTVKHIEVDQEYSDKKSPFGRAILGGLIGGAWGVALGALSAHLSSVSIIVSIIETNNEVIIFESV